MSSSDINSGNGSTEAQVDCALRGYSMSVLTKWSPNHWMRSATALVMALGIALLVVPASPASAATHGCYGASCTGLDPTGRCDGDAYTVASIAIDAGLYMGQLDLRYSPSCAANWGRFTSASGARDITLFLAGQPYPFGGRVTAWNPGGPSQQPVQSDYACNGAPFTSCTVWSRMVDGRGRACVGVEPFTDSPDTVDSQGWFWGPCA
jgi:hypothetical protein